MQTFDLYFELIFLMQADVFKISHVIVIGLIIKTTIEIKHFFSFISTQPNAKLD